MLFLLAAFDLSVLAPDGSRAGLVCIPWQESSNDWKLIVGCPEMKTGEYDMHYDPALRLFHFGEEVPALLKRAEPQINKRVGELNQV